MDFYSNDSLGSWTPNHPSHRPLRPVTKRLVQKQSSGLGMRVAGENQQPVPVENLGDVMKPTKQQESHSSSSCGKCENCACDNK